MTSTAPPKRAAKGLVIVGEVPRLYLDANILLPAYLRAIFLDLADSGLVRVYWGEQVIAEVRRNLISPRFGKSPESIEKLLADMARAFPDALVRGSEKLESIFIGRTDPKDAHVAAGALKLSRSIYSGKPVILITNNIRHLPPSAFAGIPVHPARPNEMLEELLAFYPEVANVLANMLARFKAPAVGKTDLLNILDASHCQGFATALASVWGLNSES